ncbi:molybdopterin biosynthesis protein [Caloranaerobacter ferrireducens]|uniref:molybdopterin biosynthesis protein n=1 Tax=Caloranaerobacter ferrireducens TaxID=1323370 RepID=UPI00084D245C|nr:molybdopterin biosynthesis protein [Caloranaerobacter ferrireducens]
MGRRFPLSIDRNIYIGNLDVDEAKRIYFKKITKKLDYEEVDVLDSLGRLTFEAIYAKTSVPHYNAAAMDGIVVKAEKTYGASEVNPVILVEGKDFEYINTGNLVTEPYDSVIMIEDVIEIGEGKVKIIKPAYPWQHIRPIGEDIIATEMIISSKHKIRPVDLGALISGGIKTVKVYKKPKIGIIPTGSELVERVDELKEGKILESNSRVFEGLILEYGGIPKRYKPVEDDYNLLKEAIIKGIEDNDILLVNAGSSAGSKDYTVKIIKELGEVVVHGVALKPGKPTILGLINNKPVIGIPGYPVSAYLVFETFVKPLIFKFQGIDTDECNIIKAILSKRIVSSLKHKELVRVTLGHINGKYIATPLVRGAGVTMSLVRADGILEIPKNIEGIESGKEVQIKLLKAEKEIKNRLVSIGSHDLIMDVISDMMKISSGHVGSMGGIMAMRRRECHISPIHLLDPNTGQYNIPYVKKYFRGNKMVVIKGVKRLQGFIVAKGNPYNIKSFSDLTRDDITFINRQKGSGTRVLLDYNLKKIGIDANDIKGYQREMNTHMSVAMAVKTGIATTGVGILSAARAVGLDFIPVGYEDYDFLIPFEYLEKIEIQRFISILKSHEFQKRVEKLGGYKFKDTGEIIIVN